MPDLEPLFELKENLYKETCPVVLESGALEQVLVPAAVPEQEDAPPLPPETRNVVRMTFRNIDSRAVTALFIDLHVFDKVNNETEVIRDRRYLVPVAGRDETFGGEEEIPVGAAANSFSVAIKKAEFEGEDVWNGSASLLFDAIPARQPLESAFPEAEALLEQYRRDFSARPSLSRKRTRTCGSAPAGRSTARTRKSALRAAPPTSRSARCSTTVKNCRKI